MVLRNIFLGYNVLPITLYRTHDEMVYPERQDFSTRMLLASSEPAQNTWKEGQFKKRFVNIKWLVNP